MNFEIVAWKKGKFEGNPECFAMGASHIVEATKQFEKFWKAHDEYYIIELVMVMRKGYNVKNKTNNKIDKVEGKL